MKVQYSSVDSCLPHQTGVTERSIGGTDGRAAHRVGHDVMIGHQPHRISNGFVVNLDRKHHILVTNKSGVGSFDIRAAAKRVEHPLEMILAREPYGHNRQDENGYQERFAPPATGAF